MTTETLRRSWRCCAEASAVRTMPRPPIAAGPNSLVICRAGRNGDLGGGVKVVQHKPHKHHNGFHERKQKEQ
ncbi:LOW QUALITY PROTEIN: hypothetical protein BC937DRAFT_92245 [Endogone sp. FLAS-F59071]|nr:LOW QUALITY PROTEIN: hypothetical protein BC937DRAFT_92245 [Endogone sp. FLAS-F59071]|eukprot:RUS15602.1 LOW QUALITY PROTEIN: hypothetical protein BC937DRAFT_92245 [Endogone sp. FLAS-F59071]